MAKLSVHFNYFELKIKCASSENSEIIYVYYVLQPNGGVNEVCLVRIPSALIPYLDHIS